MSFTSTRNRANIKGASISNWYVKAAETTFYAIATFDFTSDLCQVTNNPFVNTNTVRVQVGVGGVLPAGLSAVTTYYVISVAGNNFQLSLTSGGAAVALVDNGTLPVFISAVDVAFYPLGKLYDGKISVKSLSQKDSKAQNQPHTVELVASAKLFNTGKAAVLKTLDALSNRMIQQAIVTSGNGTLTSTALAQPTYGFKWKFVCDSDSNKNRYLEIGATRAIAKSELTALLTTATPTIGSPVATDALYALNSMASTGLITAGFAKFEICNTYNGSFQDVGHIMNGKLIVELLVQKDSIGQELGYNMKIDFEVDAMQSSQTELAQLYALTTQDCFYKITLLDGTIVTVGGASGAQAGEDFDVNIEGDSEKIGFIKIIGSGVIQSTSLDGIFV